MALIVEDGTGSNPNANTYVDVDFLRAFASGRGDDLTGLSDEECEVLLTKAMDYLNSKKGKWQGYKTFENQPLDWPRSEVEDDWIPGRLYPYYKADEIPYPIENAQCALAIEALNHDLLPNRLTTDKGRVIREKVGDIETVYSNSGEVREVNAFAKPEAQLKHLYKKGGLQLIRT